MNESTAHIFLFPLLVLPFFLLTSISFSPFHCVSTMGNCRSATHQKFLLVLEFSDRILVVIT